MGQSVLIPEEILLGKAFHAALVVVCWQWEKGNSAKIPKPVRGELRGFKAVDNGGSRVV
jgi:hypothetical protein